MSNKLYISSLSYNIGDYELEGIFNTIGRVRSAKVIMDRDSGKSRGFGFVEMSSDEDAKKAISELNGTSHEGHTISVSIAKPQVKREGGNSNYSGRSRY